MPPKLSQLPRLTLLYLHENKIAELPREITHLGSLQELSLEWFTYTTQTNSKFLKSADAVKMFYSYVRGIATEKVMFSQFLEAYHSPKPLAHVTYTFKNRSLVQQLCANQHSHLLKQLAKDTIN